MKQKTKIILFGATGLMLLGSFTLGNFLNDSPINIDENMEKDVSLFPSKLKELDQPTLILNDKEDPKIQDTIKSVSKREKVKNLPFYSSKSSTIKLSKNISLKGINKVSNSKKQYEIDEVFTKMWDVDIGNMSYRSNFEMVDNHLYVGSNGTHYQDWHTWDEKSGVYKINTKSGQIKEKFADGEMGDMDVNGLLYYNRNLYFGNDNDEFLCTNLDGKLLWRIPVSGDVEHEPTLIKRKNGNIIVFATEVGEVRAVNPKNGKTVWDYFHPNFSGWKDGDNRLVFKLKTHFKSGKIFFDAPEIADYNFDGVADLLYNTYGMTIINGQNGKLIENYANSKGEVALINTSSSYYNPIQLGQGQNSKIVVLYEIPSSDKKKIVVYNNDGSIHNQKLISKTELLKDYDYWGSWPEKLNNNEVGFISDDVIHIYNSKDNKFSKIQNFNSITKENSNYGVNYNSNLKGVLNISLHKINTEKGICRLMKWEYDKNWEHSIIKVFSVTENKLLLTIKLPARSEGPLLVRDINGDGKQELLVECNQHLSCYDISSLKL